MAKQGKCTNCKVVWVWQDDRVPLRYKTCPWCGKVLKRARSPHDYPMKKILNPERA